MESNSNLLNNIMNKITYLTCKCAVILRETIQKDWRKLDHNSSRDMLYKFLLNTIETLDKRIRVHLSMINWSDQLKVINLDEDFSKFTIKRDEAYFFYKFDGSSNFIKGLQPFCLVTGLIENGELLCFSILQINEEKIIWYQCEEDNIYLNNKLLWTNKPDINPKKINIFNERKHQIVSIFGKNLQEVFSKIPQITKELEDCSLRITNSFFTDIFNLINNSTKLAVFEGPLHPISIFIIKNLEKLGCLKKHDFRNYFVLERKK